MPLFEKGDIVGPYILDRHLEKEGSNELWLATHRVTGVTFKLRLSVDSEAVETTKPESPSFVAEEWSGGGNKSTEEKPPFERVDERATPSSESTRKGGAWWVALLGLGLLAGAYWIVNQREPEKGKAVAIQSQEERTPETDRLRVKLSANVPARWRIANGQWAERQSLSVKRSGVVKLQAWAPGHYVWSGEFDPSRIAENEFDLRVELKKNPEAEAERVVRFSRYGREYLDLRLGKDISQRFVKVPAGSLQLPRQGGSGPRMTVSEFWISESEVTQRQWGLVMKTTVPELLDAFEGTPDADPPFGPNYPMVMVSYDEAMEYCQLISEVLGWPARLPMEMEWRYAASAGRQTPYAYGDELLPVHANTLETGLGPAPVKQFPPTRWGLYDMHGNAFEMALDYFVEWPEEDQTDYVAPAEGNLRHGLGGSWKFPRNRSDIFRRSYHGDGERYSDLGFRVVLKEP